MELNAEHKLLLEDYLLGLGDDELILGHRDSEWCGHAPILEEDIAFANLALDEIGHASLWYGLLAGLRGEDPDTYPDRLVYFRPASEFRNLQLVELPRGDWAFSILRQYLFDSLERARLEGLAGSDYTPLAEAAAKVRKEEVYHHRHSRAWVRRLGLGTAESRQRSQAALNELWPYTAQFFSAPPGEERLAAAGLAPTAGALRDAWEAEVLLLLGESGLSVPAAAARHASRQEHTPHLRLLVDELQSVAKLDPGAEW